MALAVGTIWECRQATGNDTWGGGFVAGSGGTDFSVQNGAQVAVGGGSVTSTITTTVVTFTGGTYTVLAGDVGNIVQFISGTNVTAGFYQIASVSAGLNGTWTLDRTPLTSGTTTNAVANMGGALATLAKLAGAMVASNKAYVTGAFTATATTTFAQTVSPAGGATGTRVVGYGAARGDGTHATLTLSTNTGLTGISCTGATFSVEQLDVDCGSLGTSTGIAFTGQHCRALSCKVQNFTLRGIYGNAASTTVENGEVTLGTAAGTAGIDVAGISGQVLACYVHDNACPGVKITNACNVLHCIIANNTGAASDGVLTSFAPTVRFCTIHGNGRHGINKNDNNFLDVLFLNNLLTSNGGFGIVGSTSNQNADYNYDGNAYWNNTSGARSNMDATTNANAVNPYVNVRDVTLTASPYVGPTSGGNANFGLNNTTGAGKACQAAGSPSAFLGLSATVDYPDMGAVQHKDTGTPGIIMPV